LSIPFIGHRFQTVPVMLLPKHNADHLQQRLNNVQCRLSFINKSADLNSVYLEITAPSSLQLVHIAFLPLDMAALIDSASNQSSVVPGLSLNPPPPGFPSSHKHAHKWFSTNGAHTECRSIFVNCILNSEINAA